MFLRDAYCRALDYTRRKWTGALRHRKGRPDNNVNAKSTRSILPTTVLLLLFVLVLPGTPQTFYTKGVYLADAALSAVDLPQDTSGGFGGDQEHSVAAGELSLHAPTQGSDFLSIPAPVPEFPHSVSQARAPPAPQSR